MPNFKIGFPPFVIEVAVEDLKHLSRTINRLFSRDDFEGRFHIVAKHSSKCLDVAGGSREDCAMVFQHSLHGGDNQQWTFVRTPDGYRSEERRVGKEGRSRW